MTFSQLDAMMRRRRNARISNEPALDAGYGHLYLQNEREFSRVPLLRLENWANA